MSLKQAAPVKPMDGGFPRAGSQHNINQKPLHQFSPLKAPSMN
jgi:hypothetical protein